MQIRHHNHNPGFAASLREAYEEFEHTYGPAGTDGGILVHKDLMNVLGVWTGLRPCLDAQQLRRSILELLQLQKFRMLQVVGDSGRPFNIDAVNQVLDFIKPLLKDDPTTGKTTVLEYGYTAVKHDTNWIVNELVDVTPGLGSRTIANVVYESILAVENWNCEATANVWNFVLAYDVEATKFGSDVFLSDEIMSGLEGDKLLCLEGGAQAFAQAVNVLFNGVHVIAVTGPNTRKVESAFTAARFSAARLLKIMSERYQQLVGEAELTLITQNEIPIGTNLAGLEYLNNLASLPWDAIQEPYQRLMTKPQVLKNVEVKDLQ